MDIFLIRVTPPQEEPQADALGSIPEEGIVIGDPASSKLLLLKALQWEKMWRWKTVILMIMDLCRPGLMFVFVL